MRWFLVSAALVVLGTILLFNFALKAKAETWSCAYVRKGILINHGRMEKDKIIKILFTRDAPFKGFRQVEDGKLNSDKKGFLEKIHLETDDVIHLYRYGFQYSDKDSKRVTLLDKKKQAFMSVFLSGSGGGKVKKGPCTIH